MKSSLQAKLTNLSPQLYLCICVFVFLYQAKLTNLAINIGYGGMAISFVTVLILFIRFSIDTFTGEKVSFFFVI